MRFPTLLLLFFILALYNPTLRSQEADSLYANLMEKAVRVFIDCSRCDEDYIRREIPFVNYVRDPREAQVHVLVTRQSTGASGIEYRMAIIGRQKFEGINNEVVYTSLPDETGDMIRSGYTRMMAAGLMPYVSKTPLATYIKFHYDHQSAGTNEENTVEDKWKSWVFNISTKGDIQDQASYSSFSTENDVAVNKVTPEWKINFSGSYDVSYRIYRYDEEEYRSTRASYSIRHLTVKSINDHWSLGGRAGIWSSTYGNTRFSASLAPAIEYNIFRYQESNRKQVRFQYRVGYGYTFYQDTTIYDKLEEGLFSHQFSIASEFRQPWGSVSFSGQASNYLHDWSKYSFRLWTGIYLRVFKGLSLSISGDAAFIHDQLALAKAGATEQEVLLRLKQMAT
ncbi:MAG: hypothetical protein R6V75_03340, partial [Bacteroidales bacterium]